MLVQEYDFLSVYLSSYGSEIKRVKYTISILNSNSEETHVLAFEQIRDFSIGWGNDLISTSELLRNAAELLPKNTLTLVLTVIYI